MKKTVIFILMVLLCAAVSFAAVNSISWYWESGDGALSFRYQVDSEEGEWIETADNGCTLELDISVDHIIYVQASYDGEHWSNSAASFCPAQEDVVFETPIIKLDEPVVVISPEEQARIAEEARQAEEARKAAEAELAAQLEANRIAEADLLAKQNALKATEEAKAAHEAEIKAHQETLQAAKEAKEARELALKAEKAAKKEAAKLAAQVKAEEKKAEREAKWDKIEADRKEAKIAREMRIAEEAAKKAAAKAEYDAAKQAALAAELEERAARIEAERVARAEATAKKLAIEAQRKAAKEAKLAEQKAARQEKDLARKALNAEKREAAIQRREEDRLRRQKAFNEASVKFNLHETLSDLPTIAFYGSPATYRYVFRDESVGWNAKVTFDFAKFRIFRFGFSASYDSNYETNGFETFRDFTIMSRVGALVVDYKDVDFSLFVQSGYVCNLEYSSATQNSYGIGLELLVDIQGARNWVLSGGIDQLLMVDENGDISNKTSFIMGAKYYL